MIVKTRTEPRELRLFRALNSRMDLSTKDETYYSNLEKGYQGELQFDEWLLSAAEGGLILNDLLLEMNNTLFQIDSLLITAYIVYLFEVKNFEGDFVAEGDQWFTASKTEIKNPLLQLKRNEQLFRRLLQEIGCKTKIQSHLIFINPEFQLYQAPLNLPAVFHPQLNRFAGPLKKDTSLKLSSAHTKLADRLAAAHLDKSPFSSVPEYGWEGLRKGIGCRGCGVLYEYFDGKNLKCNHCGGKESYATAIIRAAEEYKLLFPDRKVTTNGIYEWCEVIKNRKTIRKALTGTYDRLGSSKSSYFVDRS
ncbi:nuclease-related domain-containing protein [Bacillus sp. UMB0728]|uniref:nuclease-related domain-containing protein n=1 Tax=Bacillus sp. UMB0728 TaxID=2066052 RepID=UPI000C763323|nr:nuclease-related domain-containing protein [Bacillus sp. UMB0728]PLR74354.1 hypothetical protein CYJ37_01615 [Bacillus sp. UMB0728]